MEEDNSVAYMEHHEYGTMSDTSEKEFMNADHANEAKEKNFDSHLFD